MYVHSCCCILFCFAWFEVRFQIDLNLHFEIALEKLEKRKMSFFPPLPCVRPVGLLPSPWPLLHASPLAPCASLRSLRGPTLPYLPVARCSWPSFVEGLVVTRSRVLPPSC